MQITLNSLKQKTFIKALIYGSPGTGKTYAGASTGRKTMYLLTEAQGLETLRILLSQGKIHPESRIELIETWDEWIRLTTSPTWEATLKTFDLLILDTLDDLDDRIQAAIAKSKGTTTIDEVEDFGRSLSSAMHRLQSHVIDPVRSWPIDCVVFAHQNIDIQKDAKGAVVGTKISPRVFKSDKRQMVEVSCSKFAIVGHARMIDVNGNARRKVHFSSPDAYTKAHPALNREEDLDLAAILGKIEAYHHDHKMDAPRTEAPAPVTNRTEPPTATPTPPPRRRAPEPKPAAPAPVEAKPEAPKPDESPVTNRAEPPKAPVIPK